MDLTANQATSFYTLVSFLRRMRVIGLISAQTLSNRSNGTYNIVITDYDSSKKGALTNVETLERALQAVEIYFISSHELSKMINYL